MKQIKLLFVSLLVLTSLTSCKDIKSKILYLRSEMTNIYSQWSTAASTTSMR